MRCSNGSFDNPDGMNFCGQCGVELSSLCAQCGFDNPPGFQLCGQCGAALTRPTAPEASPSASEPRRPSPAAERRQLTVMFCDLVGSTQLSGRLDPEDLREVIRAYQQTCAEVITRYEGHIAQYLGDGLLVYFGYPVALEDNAQRAIHAGLGIVAALGALRTRVEAEYGATLAVRIGVHTGAVVIGEMGGGDRYENLALGETPNIAARLEGLAPPNQVVISAATRRLVEGAFELADLGAPALKGVVEPMPVYGVRRANALESRFEAAAMAGLTPLVGREEELGLVRRRWEQAKESEGQVALLCGEPGIGKSRLAQALREQVAQEPHVRLRYQCSPYYILESELLREESDQYVLTGPLSRVIIPDTL